MGAPAAIDLLTPPYISMTHHTSLALRRLALATALLAPAPGVMANLLVNGDFSQGIDGWSGFLNTVDHPTAADDFYYLKPLVNVQQTPAGAVLFKGFYDPSGPGSYAYRLAPPRPHISQSMFLAAGTYTLSWDDMIVTHGMQATQKFEVLLDGVQVLAQDFWIAQTGSGAQPSGHKTYTLDIAAEGLHSLAFGLSTPGYNWDTQPSWVQYANQITVDNISLLAVAAAPANVVPEPASLALLGLGGAVLTRLRSSRIGKRAR